MSLEEGSRLGPYKVLGKLGEGGMGAVYRAQDSSLGRDVAIKVLPEMVATNRVLLERFRREAQLLAAVRHPNVATVFQFEEANGMPFLVMELVEGPTLADELRRGPLELSRALRVAEAVAQGLEAAHRRGIVHRDLKPANVALTVEKEVKVLDFGLAKLLAPAPEEAHSQLDTRTADLTREGAVLGTMPYMSPEQVRGEPLDERADVWALGCLLFEALTGRRPFGDGHDGATAAAILAQEPSWDLLPAGAPPSVRRLLRRALSKDPDRRLRHVGDARLELLDAIEGTDEGTQVKAQPATRRRLLLTGTLTMLIGALGATALLMSTRPGPVPERVTRSLIPLIGGAEASAGALAELKLAPDGGRLAYVLNRQESSALYLRELSRLEPRLVSETPSRRLRSLFFSPDVLWVGYIADGVLWRASVSGGAPVSVTRIGNNRGGSWGDQGIVLGTAVAVGGMMWSSAQGDVSALTEPDLAKLESSHRWPEMLPDSNAILFTIVSADDDSPSEASIALYDLRTQSYEVVLVGGYGARYSPTGHLVYAHVNEILAVPFDLDSLEVTGTPVQMVDDLFETFGAPLFDLAPDGTLVYAPGGSLRPHRRVLLVDRRGEMLRVLREGRRYMQPRFSPDGGRLCLVVEQETHDIVVVDLERGTEIPITHRWINWFPRWSSDGSSLFFQSSRSGRLSTYRRKADGTGPIDHAVPFPSSTSITEFVPSPDGSRAIVWDGSDLLAYDPEQGDEPRAFIATESREMNAVFSSDGSWVAFESDKSGRWEVYLRPFPSGSRELKVSEDGGLDARWGPDDAELFYRSGNRILSVDVDLDTREASLGAPRVLFELPSLLRDGWDVSPDGQTFAIVEPEEERPSPSHLVLVRGFDRELRAVGATAGVAR